MTDPSWAGRRVLITGATGFIGAALGRRLTEAGAEVSGVARRQPSTTASEVVPASATSAATVSSRVARSHRRVVPSQLPVATNRLSRLTAREREVHHWLDIRQDRQHDWPVWREMFPHYLSRIKF